MFRAEYIFVSTLQKIKDLNDVYFSLKCCSIFMELAFVGTDVSHQPSYTGLSVSMGRTITRPPPMHTLLQQRASHSLFLLLTLVQQQLSESLKHRAELQIISGFSMFSSASHHTNIFYLSI